MDPIAEWQAAQARTSELVAGLDEEQLARHVPACPDWTVRDLFSHVVGLGADVLAGDEPDDHRASWTQAQVEARAARSARELLAEWDEVSARLPAWMAEHGSRPLNDVIIHEQDLRGAVGLPGARASDGLAIVRDRMAGRLAERVADLPVLALEEEPGPAGPGWRWTSHGGAGAGAGGGGGGGADVGGGAEPMVVLRASGFDLARALASRRTPGQLRSWTVRGDVTGHLDAFAGLGPLPERPLPE